MAPDQGIFGLVAVLVGGLATLGSVLNWRHFIYYGESFGTDLPGLIGEKNARIALGILGALVFLMGALVMTGIIELSSPEG